MLTDWGIRAVTCDEAGQTDRCATTVESPPCRLDLKKYFGAEIGILGSIASASPLVSNPPADCQAHRTSVPWLHRWPASKPLLG